MSNKTDMITNASPSAYGWCFQVGAGITLMLDNIKDFTSIKMEGKSDDIEINTPTGENICSSKICYSNRKSKQRVKKITGLA